MLHVFRFTGATNPHEEQVLGVATPDYLPETSLLWILASVKQPFSQQLSKKKNVLTVILVPLAFLP